MDKELQFHIVERDGPIIIWKFNNPPKNLLNAETWVEFDALVEAFEADADLRVAIFTSALPDVLVQHADVSRILQRAEALRTSAGAPPPRPATQRPVRAIDRPRTKPIICAINGQVGGGGAILTINCDFRLMSRKATISWPEVNLGIIPGRGAPPVLSRLVGTGRALEMLIFGRKIGADEAERVGLVHRACDPEELMSAALELARELVARPPLAIAALKQCLYEGSDMPLEEFLALESRLFAEAAASDDAFRIMSEYVAGGQNVESVSC